MKNILFTLALLISFSSFGQTYADIISIDSKEQFLRIGIENDYEIIENEDGYVQMAINPKYENNGDVKSRRFAEFRNDNKFLQFSSFQFIKGDPLSNVSADKKIYDDVFSAVKEYCAFKEVDKTGFSYYTVRDNFQIGFKIDKDWCYIILTNVKSLVPPEK